MGELLDFVDERGFHALTPFNNAFNSMEHKDLIHQVHLSCLIVLPYFATSALRWNSITTVVALPPAQVICSYVYGTGTGTEYGVRAHRGRFVFYIL